MATSWTQADLAALEAAIKRGVTSVSYADRQVQYASPVEMLKVRETMRSALDAESSIPAVRTTYARFRKGSE